MKPAFLVSCTFAIMIFAFSGCKNYQSRVGRPTGLSIALTPERVRRGEYLANHVAVCMDCHSQRDYTRFAGPIVTGSLGNGGQVFDHKMGLPGTFYGKNLTPAALKTWTDGKLYRAITTGVAKDGSALFPLMPYQNYGKMDPDDIQAIIAYLRTLSPIDREIPVSRPDFWVKPLLRQFPGRARPQPRPARQDTLAYGRYLVGFAGCADCHTQRRIGMPVKRKAFAGGMGFPMPGRVIRSANLTPDQETGIGSWTKAAFLARFNAFDPNTFTPFEAKTGFNTPMPWTLYSGMTDDDLGAIYTYLRSLKPIKKYVVTLRPKGRFLAKTH